MFMIPMKFISMPTPKRFKVQLSKVQTEIKNKFMPHSRGSSKQKRQEWVSKEKNDADLGVESVGLSLIVISVTIRSITL